MKNLILATILVTSSAFAHEEHDWRQDYNAYLSVQYELPMSYQKTTAPKFFTKRVDMNFFKDAQDICFHHVQLSDSV